MNASDPLFRHVKTGKLYRVLERYDQVSRDIETPRVLCQLVMTVTPRVYSTCTAIFHLKSLVRVG